MDVFIELSFEAAHSLPHVAPDHKCARLHGHSYRVVIHVNGPDDPVTGMVLDFADISAAVKPIVDGDLDHRYLNDIPGLENPTSEQVARWLWERLKPQLELLSAVQVRETCTSGCIFRGD